MISTFIPAEILSRAANFPNIRYGDELLSALEIVRVHTPSITFLPSSTVSSHLRDLHITQQSSLTLRRVLHYKHGRGLSRHLLSKDQRVYYFHHSGTFGC